MDTDYRVSILRMEPNLLQLSCIDSSSEFDLTPPGFKLT